MTYHFGIQHRKLVQTRISDEKCDFKVDIYNSIIIYTFIDFLANYINWYPGT